MKINKTILIGIIFILLAGVIFLTDSLNPIIRPMPEQPHGTALACLCLFRAGMPEWCCRGTLGGRKLLCRVGIMAPSRILAGSRTRFGACFHLRDAQWEHRMCKCAQAHRQGNGSASILMLNWLCLPSLNPRECLTSPADPDVAWTYQFFSGSLRCLLAVAKIAWHQYY